MRSEQRSSLTPDAVSRSKVSVSTNGVVRPCPCPRQRFKLARGAKDKERAMSQTPKTVGIDVGKNSFHVVGHNEAGAVVLRQKWSRGQLEAR
jgi:hypothetical protein